MRSIKFASVGECIYCGERKPKLTDEHIVPYGLGGPWILPQASCERCQRITSATELAVLRGQLWQVRSKLSLPSRKNSLPVELPLVVGLGDDLKTLHLPKADHPTVASFLLYSLPGALGGDAPERGINVVGHQAYQIGGPPLSEVVKAAGANRVTFEISHEGNEFERLLAKIALGFAVAQVGVAAVRDSPLQKTILGDADDAGRWVGCGLWHPSPSLELHQIQLEAGCGWLLARVRLFASTRTPEYVVVVLPGSREGLPRVAHGDPEGVLKGVQTPGATVTVKASVHPRNGGPTNASPSQ